MHVIQREERVVHSLGEVQQHEAALVAAAIAMLWFMLTYCSVRACGRDGEVTEVPQNSVAITGLAGERAA
jgi:uncharacterized membrane protein YozB (DUF420 family)